MSNLTNNTAELNKILAAVNALPEAGGGGINPTGEIEITENGTYDVTNYASAEVNVPSEEPVLQEGNATPTKSQQTIEPPSGVDGFSKFVVEKIPDQYIIPEGTAEITKNGEHDVTGYAKVDVNVPDIPAVTEELSVTENGTWEPGTGVDGFSKVVVNVPDIPAVVQPLEVTENGTYTAPAGVDGYSPVTVNVPSENLDAEISEQAAKIDQLLTILDGKAASGALPADPVLEELNVTENGVYEPGNGADGFSKVTVAVPTGGGSDTIETCTLRLVGAKDENSWLPIEKNARFRGVIYQSATINSEGVLQTSWEKWPEYGSGSQELVELENVVINSPITLSVYCPDSLASTEGVNVDVLCDDYGNSENILVQCTKANDICTFTVANG